MAAKRFIVEAPIAEAFEMRFVEAVKALKIGDPLDEQTYIGPMARYDLRDELDEQVKASLRQGARLVLGGEKIAGQGNYYAPTILSDVTSDMTAFRQELLGLSPLSQSPVMRIMRWKSLITANSDSVQRYGRTTPIVLSR